MNSPGGPQNPQNLYIFSDRTLSYTRYIVLGGPENICTRSSFIAIDTIHCRPFTRGPQIKVEPANQFMAVSSNLLIQCFCNNNHSPGPHNLKTSDVIPQNSGHRSPQLHGRTCGIDVLSPVRSMTQQPLWTRDQVHAALRSTKGCHKDPLLRLNSEPTKEEPKALQSFLKGFEQQCKLGQNRRGIFYHHTTYTLWGTQFGIPTKAVHPCILKNPVNFKAAWTVTITPKIKKTLIVIQTRAMIGSSWVGDLEAGKCHHRSHVRPTISLKNVIPTVP